MKRKILSRRFLFLAQVTEGNIHFLLPIPPCFVETLLNRMAWISTALCADVRMTNSTAHYHLQVFNKSYSAQMSFLFVLVPSTVPVQIEWTQRRSAPSPAPYISLNHKLETGSVCVLIITLPSIVQHSSAHITVVKHSSSYPDCWKAPICIFLTLINRHRCKRNKIMRTIFSNLIFHYNVWVPSVYFCNVAVCFVCGLHFFFFFLLTPSAPSSGQKI